MAYVGAPGAAACIFCEPPGDSLRQGLVLGRSRHSLVILNRYPYQSGHLLVAPRRHGVGLASLPADEHVDLQETLRRSLAALERTLEPGGFNVGLNVGACAGAGIVDHLHWHVVPRWAGDTNFMPMLAEVRVMPQHLDETYDRLRGAFDWLDASS